MEKRKNHTIGVSIALVLVLALAGIILWPTSTTGNAVHEFEIIDNCGRFANLISHTISDSRTCAIRCEDQCEVAGYELRESNFAGYDDKCNDCHCTCKKKGWF